MKESQILIVIETKNFNNVNKTVLQDFKLPPSLQLQFYVIFPDMVQKQRFFKQVLGQFPVFLKDVFIPQLQI